MARGTILLAALLVAVVSLGGVLLFLAYSGDTRLEQSFCRYLVCDSEMRIEAGYQAMYKGGTGEGPLALDAFREALRRNPASPDRWCDLAGALAQYGRKESAGYCYGRAMQLAPNSPQVWLRAANFSFSEGDNGRALERYARVLSLVSVYESVVFNYYDIMGLPLEEILARGIPPDRLVAQSYFRFLLGKASAQDMQRAWTWVTSKAFADDPLAGQYVDGLLRQGKPDDAAAAWKQYMGKRAKGYLESNFLYNGDFESEPTQSVFDWRLSPVGGLQQEFDESVVYSGKRSLRLDLQGTENVSFGGVSQRTVIRPGAYRFRAYVRSEDLSTDHGLVLRVFDAESPGRLDVRTDEVIGSTKWKLLEKTFAAGPQTRLLEVQLIREPSLKFDNKIRGRLWLDHLTLERVGASQ